MKQKKDSTGDLKQDKSAKTGESKSARGARSPRKSIGNEFDYSPEGQENAAQDTNAPPRQRANTTSTNFIPYGITEAQVARNISQNQRFTEIAEQAHQAHKIPKQKEEKMEESREEYLNKKSPQRQVNIMRKKTHDSKGEPVSTAHLLEMEELTLENSSLDNANSDETKKSVADAIENPEKMPSLQKTFEQQVKSANGEPGKQFEFAWNDKNPLSVTVNDNSGQPLFKAVVGENSTTYEPVGEKGLEAALKAIAESPNKTIAISGTKEQRMQILTKIQTTPAFRDNITISEKAWKGLDKVQVDYLKGLKSAPEAQNKAKVESSVSPDPPRNSNVPR